MTEPTRPVGLADAQPDLVRDDLSRSEAVLRSAAVAFTDAKAALDGPVGPHTQTNAQRLKLAAIALAAAAEAFAQEKSR